MAITKEVVQSEFQRLLGRAASPEEVAFRIKQNAPNLAGELMKSAEYTNRQNEFKGYSQRGLTEYDEALAKAPGTGGQELLGGGAAKTVVNPQTGLTELAPGQNTANILAQTFGKPIETPTYSAANKRAIEDPVDGQLPGGVTPYEQSRQAAQKYFESLTPEQQQIKLQQDQIAKQQEQIAVITDAKKRAEQQVFTIENERNNAIENPFMPASEKEAQIAQYDAQIRAAREAALTEIFKQVPNALDDPALAQQLMAGAGAGMSMTDLKAIQAQAVAPALGQTKVALGQYGKQFLEPKYYDDYIANSGLDETGAWTFERIQQEAGVPDEMRKFYYGDGETTGQIQLMRDAVQKQIDSTLTEMTNTTGNLKKMYDLTIEATKYDLASQLMDVEEKRQQTKTYLTGYLAKLGALNTTGAAGTAVANIEAKYDRIKADTQFKYANLLAQKEVDFTGKIQDITDKTNDAIVKVLSNQQKTEGDIAQEIMKIQRDTDKRITDLGVNFYKEASDIKGKAITYATNQTKDEIKDLFDAIKTGSESLPAGVINKLIATKAADKAMDDRIKQASSAAKQASIARAKAEANKYTDLNKDLELFLSGQRIVTKDGQLLSTDLIAPGKKGALKFDPSNVSANGETISISDNKDEYFDKQLMPAIRQMYPDVNPTTIRSVAKTIGKSYGYNIDSGATSAEDIAASAMSAFNSGNIDDGGE